MSIPTVMRWDHKNAPQILNMRSWDQIKAWYTAIFTDGYLADDDTTLIPPLGWDLTFHATLKIAYLHQDTDADLQLVNRMYLRFDYDNVTDGNDWGDYANAYNNQGGILLTDWGNGGSPYGMPIFYGNTNNGTNRICPWVVIGNNRGVYFLVGYNPSTTAPIVPEFSNLNNYSTWQYFGDFVNDGVDYGKNNQTCTYGYTGQTNSSSYYFRNYLNTNADWAGNGNLSKFMYYDNYNTYMGMHITHDEDGNTRGTNFTATPFGLGYGGNWIGRNSFYDLPYPYVDGSLKIIPFDLWIRNNQATPIYNEKNQVYIGKMPGLYFPMHYTPLANAKNLLEFEGSGEYEGQFFLGLGQTGYCEFYINITEDWGI